MSTVHTAPPRSKRREPNWEIVESFTAQGEWSEEEYLELDTNRLIEFTDGRLEVLPMPKTSHQRSGAHLFEVLRAFVSHGKAGEVLYGGVRIRLRPGMIREPDIVFMLAEHSARVGEDYWDGADLVMEVVSPGAKDRERNLRRKRLEYAAAGIPEYWIIDPKLARITVLRLEGDHYVVHGEFKPGEQASSVLLKGFTVDVAAVLAGK
ncbi:MAG: Uma2 family endonuclease [Planctomycetota bacterium]